MCKLEGSEIKEWILNGAGAGGAGASGSDSDEEDSEWEDDAPSSSEDESSSDSVGMPYVEALRIGLLNAQSGRVRMHRVRWRFHGRLTISSGSVN